MCPIEIQVDLCNCCKAKTKRFVWRGEAFEGMEANYTVFPLYKKYLVLLNMKIGKMKRIEKTQDYLGVV